MKTINFERLKSAYHNLMHFLAVIVFNFFLSICMSHELPSTWSSCSWLNINLDSYFFFKHPKTGNSVKRKLSNAYHANQFEWEITSKFYLRID